MRIRYTLVTIAAMVVFFSVQITVTSVAAATLDEQCQPLYEQFMQSETYDQAGQSAWQMMELNCWPALQDTQQTEYVPITDCESLGTLVIQNSDWAKVYEPKPVVYWNAEEQERTDVLMATGTKLGRFMLAADERARHMLQVMNNAEAPPGGTRTLECLAKVRTDQGFQLAYYYLDNDDGEEWWGYLYME